MADFLGGSEIAARAQMLAIDNKLASAQVAAQKTKVENVKTGELANLKKVSQEFESIFLGYMLKQMRKTVPPDPLFGDSTAKGIFYDMHDDEMAKELSKAGGIGLAVILYNQLSKNSEIQK